MGVLIIRAVLLGVYVRAADFEKFPHPSLAGAGTGRRACRGKTPPRDFPRRAGKFSMIIQFSRQSKRWRGQWVLSAL